MAKSNTTPPRQKNLFSFFSKKTSPSSVSKNSAKGTDNGGNGGNGGNGSAKASGSKSAKSPSSPSASSNSSNSSNTSNNSSNSNNGTSKSKAPSKLSKQQMKLLSKVMVGTRLAVYWPDDKEYYPCVVSNHRPEHGEDKGHTYTLKYDDGEIETIDLAGERFRIIGGKKRDAASSSSSKESSDGGDSGGGSGSGGSDSSPASSPNSSNSSNSSNPEARKRRRILESDDEDMDDSDTDSDGNDSGSEYKAGGGEDSMEEDLDGDLEDTEEEEFEEESDFEEEETKKKSSRKGTKGKAKVTVTRVNASGTSGTSGTSGASSRFVSPTPTKQTPMNSRVGTNSCSSSSDINFTDFVSQSIKNNSSPSRESSSQITPKSTSSPRPITQSQPEPQTTQSTQSIHSSQPTQPPPPRPTAGIVNPPGSHLHNHLAFFTTHRLDLHRQPSTSPTHNPRTLHIDYPQLERITKQLTGPKASLTPAQRQWWEIKSQYADTVLLFKTGKFYEMFHDDADVGYNVLGNIYMKGILAHGGFPEAAYGVMTRKLVDAGYKVARVEQTETPDGLNERKKGMTGKGKKPQVVCREVCGVVTRGTRTFCYLEDVSVLDEGRGRGGSGNGKGGVMGGPLVVIKEILHSDGDDARKEDDGSTGTKAVCEYGVTIVDAITGSVTLGQFADDVLRSRMVTLLATFSPSEILYEGGPQGASPTLLSLLRSTINPTTTSIEPIHPKERFPKSTAISLEARQHLDRLRGVSADAQGDVRPWDGGEAVKELKRRGYYPRSSRKVRNEGIASEAMEEGIGRWPEVLKACIQGGAELALSSFGAALFYLQRNLIDTDILGMNIVKAYIPPNNGLTTSGEANPSNHSDQSNQTRQANPSTPSSRVESSNAQLQQLSDMKARRDEGLDLVDPLQEEPLEQDRPHHSANGQSCINESPISAAELAAEAQIDHMALDGTTLTNLEILHSLTSNTNQNSLLSKIDFTQSPHGSRLLRAWLLRPLFRKADIDRRANVVEELTGGSAAVAMEEARSLLKRVGDVERLLSRVHSMGGGCGRGGGNDDVEDGGSGGGRKYHPSERAVLYEGDKHTKRKVSDFSKLMNGLRSAADIPDVFSNVDIQSPMLEKIVRTTDDGGCFPSDMKEKLDWFFDNFDCQRAARGEFEPTRGMDQSYDDACDAIESIKRDLEAYKEEMCSVIGRSARSEWKYVNVKEDAKDKYLIELPASLPVPNEFYVKGKRGKGANQRNKYITPIVEQLVHDLERAIDVKKEGKAAGMKLVFAKFDSYRSVWTAASHASAMLDALGSLAQLAVLRGFCRPIIMDCGMDENGNVAKPGIRILQGRHPCVHVTHSGGSFIPNDLVLGGRLDADDDRAGQDEASVLLLSGPNMGGKSTLLRQTCLITILAQIGSFVPAEYCALTPVDRIFTRLGASDRILCGQSTFFVELAETAAAVRGATRRSLVIMDELGRGTSTFDGTAIASGTVKHLVEVNRCLTLFATHYHSLLEDWKNEPSIRLGHMECIVEDDGPTDNESEKRNNITFLYTLGEGPCPKSFGVNVARLAGLPDDVLIKAKAVSAQFEAEMNGSIVHKIRPAIAVKTMDDIVKLAKDGDIDVDALKSLWKSLQ